MTRFNIILFDDFETLDALGPAEVIGKIPDLYHLDYYSLTGGVITSAQNLKICTRPFHEMDPKGYLLIPGGAGTRSLVQDSAFIQALAAATRQAPYILTVCTGSALLAKTGRLDNKQATSNKRAFDWVKSIRPAVHWQEKARWVVDGHTYSSSGVSAGIDMTLGFISDLHGKKTAQEIADRIEYLWNSDPTNDPFSP